MRFQLRKGFSSAFALLLLALLGLAGMAVLKVQSQVMLERTAVSAKKEELEVIKKLSFPPQPVDFALLEGCKNCIGVEIFNQNFEYLPVNKVEAVFLLKTGGEIKTGNITYVEKGCLKNGTYIPAGGSCKVFFALPEGFYPENVSSVYLVFFDNTTGKMLVSLPRKIPAGLFAFEQSGVSEASFSEETGQESGGESGGGGGGSGPSQPLWELYPYYNLTRTYTFGDLLSNSFRKEIASLGREKLASGPYEVAEIPLGLKYNSYYPGVYSLEVSPDQNFIIAVGIIDNLNKIGGIWVINVTDFHYPFITSNMTFSCRVSGMAVDWARKKLLVVGYDNCSYGITLSPEYTIEEVTSDLGYGYLAISEDPERHMAYKVADNKLFAVNLTDFSQRVIYNGVGTAWDVLYYPQAKMLLLANSSGVFAFNVSDLDHVTFLCGNTSATYASKLAIIPGTDDLFVARGKPRSIETAGAVYKAVTEYIFKDVSKLCLSKGVAVYSGFTTPADFKVYSLDYNLPGLDLKGTFAIFNGVGSKFKLYRLEGNRLYDTFLSTADPWLYYVYAYGADQSRGVAIVKKAVPVVVKSYERELHFIVFDNYTLNSRTLSVQYFNFTGGFSAGGFSAAPLLNLSSTKLVFFRVLTDTGHYGIIGLNFSKGIKNVSVFLIWNPCGSKEIIGPQYNLSKGVMFFSCYSDDYNIYAYNITNLTSPEPLWTISTSSTGYYAGNMAVDWKNNILWVQLYDNDFRSCCWKYLRVNFTDPENPVWYSFSGSSWYSGSARRYSGSIYYRKTENYENLYAREINSFADSGRIVVYNISGNNNTAQSYPGIQTIGLPDDKPRNYLISKRKYVTASSSTWSSTTRYSIGKVYIADIDPATGKIGTVYIMPNITVDVGSGIYPSVFDGKLDVLPLSASYSYFIDDTCSASETVNCIVGRYAIPGFLAVNNTDIYYISIGTNAIQVLNITDLVK